MDVTRLVSFPRYILVGVLNSWLGLKDIAKLDTACGASRNSAELHKTISSGLTLVQNIAISKVEVVDWLVTRKFSLRSVDVRSLSLATKQFVAVCCQHLTHLGLHSEVSTTAADFVNLVNLQSICQRLESLRCSGKLSKEALSVLICSVPSLKRIDLMKCTMCDEHLVQLLADNCPHLVEFRCPCFGISGPEMVNLAKKCPGLEVVNAGYTYRHNKHQQAPDHSPEFIALCPNLTELCVPVISEAAIRKIAECCPLLTVLDCNCARDTPNDALEAMTRSCPLIRKLALKMFETLEARVICPLADLEELLVVYSVAMDDAGVQNIVRSCPKLSSVELLDCRSLTEESAYAMLTGLPKLRNLQLHSETSEWESKRTSWHRLAHKFLKLHYAHVRCRLEFDD